MSFVIALLLVLQVGDSTDPATQPSQPARTYKASASLGIEIPAVYSSNYATKYFGLDSGPRRSRGYIAPPMYYPPPPPRYYAPFYYPSFRSVLFAPAPFIRGNYFNPGPFFRPLGAPGQPTPRMGHRGAAHRR